MFGVNGDDAVVTRYTSDVCVCVRGGRATGDERLNGTLSHWYAQDTRSQTSSRTYLYVRTIAGTYTYIGTVCVIIHVLYYGQLLGFIVVCTATAMRIEHSSFLSTAEVVRWWVIVNSTGEL